MMYTVQHVFCAENTRVPPEYFVIVSGIPPDCYFGKTHLCFFVYLKEVGMRGYIATISTPQVFGCLPEKIRNEIIRPAIENGAIFEA